MYNLRSRRKSKEEKSTHRSESVTPDFSSAMKGDGSSIVLLLFLYVLQGIPLGLAAAVPFILTQRHVSYKEQAEFSFWYNYAFLIITGGLPLLFSLWAKKNMVGSHTGITMYLLSQSVDALLEEGNIPALTALFFFLNFLAATQDIAVDGWALTMLKRENVGYASTCNSVGQTAGYFLGYVGYIGLESIGLVTLSGFLLFWGVVFFAATTFVALLKHENEIDENPGDHQEMSLINTYKLLWKILQLGLVKTMALVLLTSKIGFSATDSVTSLKLIEAGVPKDKLAMLAVPMIPLQILLPLLVSRYTTGPKPMDVFLKAMPPRLLFGVIFAVFVYMTPSMADNQGYFPWYYYGTIIVIYSFHQITTNCMFVAVMAFFSRISDPAVGGTYMTLLNTLTNLGGNWPATLALWCVDGLTVKECQGAKANETTESLNDGCYGKDNLHCLSSGGTCVTVTEGYYVESAFCVLFGCLWLWLWGWNTLKKLQSTHSEDWWVVKSEKKTSSD